MTVEALSSTADLEEAREKLIQSFAGLSDDLLDEANVVGHWSIRECLAHILAWDQWGQDALAALERGEPVTPPGEHEMNSRAVAGASRESGATLSRRLREARAPILARLAAKTDSERCVACYCLADKTLSADDFVDSFIDHDLEHASEIRAWRKAQSL